MTTPTLSFEELEALHDVLEAARCYWHQQPALHDRAAAPLRLVNKLYWRLGEELPKTGTPSGRFGPVMHSSGGDVVERLLDVVEEITREHTNAYDPWWADTIVASQSVIKMLKPNELEQFRASLQRLGLTLQIDAHGPPDQMSAERQDRGPWAA